jgi:hypothetical protein
MSAGWLPASTNAQVGFGADGNGEAANHRIAAREQHRGDGEPGPRTIGVRDSSETHALGVVTTVAERIAASVAQGWHHATGCQMPRVNQPPT